MSNVGSRSQVSIIIPTCDNLEGLTACLKSIRTNTINYEIIIMVNSAVKKYHSDVATLIKGCERIISFNKRMGFITPCNVGAREAVGECLIVLNDDVIVGKDWTFRLVRSIDDNVKLVGPSLKHCDDRYNSVFYVTCCPYIEGWCFALDMKVYKELGELFDPELTWSYCEDVDLSKRVMSLGYGIAPIDIPISHVGSATLKRMSKSAVEKCKKYEVINKTFLMKKWRIR